MTDEVVRSAGVAHELCCERRRQVEAGKATDARDDDYQDGELALAAASYALSASTIVGPENSVTVALKVSPPQIWPWDRVYWNPKNARADLVRAGALIIAEIERLDRATGRPQ